MLKSTSSGRSGTGRTSARKFAPAIGKSTKAAPKSDNKDLHMSQLEPAAPADDTPYNDEP